MIPPSLRNIFQEVSEDCYKNNKNNYLNRNRHNGSLIRWSKQGVLLLNSILTVREGNPTSHKEKGWEILTDKIINFISLNKKNVVFLLWGNFAKKKEHLISLKNDHYVLKTSHPSPFSVKFGFKGSNHFSKTNNFLKRNNKKEIIW